MRKKMRSAAAHFYFFWYCNDVLCRWSYLLAGVTSSFSSYRPPRTVANLSTPLIIKGEFKLVHFFFPLSYSSHFTVSFSSSVQSSFLLHVSCLAIVWCLCLCFNGHHRHHAPALETLKYTHTLALAFVQLAMLFSCWCSLVSASLPLTFKWVWVSFFFFSSFSIAFHYSVSTISCCCCYPVSAHCRFTAQTGKNWWYVGGKRPPPPGVPPKTKCLFNQKGQIG